MPIGSSSSRWAANRLGLDYRAEARRLGPPVVPVIDVHTHLNGPATAGIYAEVRATYGIEKTYSMTQVGQADSVRQVLGDTVEFIAIPSYMYEDRARAMRQGFLDNIERFHGEFGSRIVKFWAAPRARDFVGEGDADVVGLDSHWKIRAAELAQRLGMMFMVHIADPDTWFATKYADASVYGTKRSQYHALQRMLDRFEGPWIAAHMGGWPEDLDFLDGLLERHDNLYLDSSATKWMARELSRHPHQRFRAFMTRWRGRILFGSDIVANDEHLVPDAESSRFGQGSESPDQAFELYASRYWTLRTLFESDYDGQSPIADPDLAMVDPARHDALSAPKLVGRRLPADLLRPLYREALLSLLAR